MSNLRTLLRITSAAMIAALLTSVPTLSRAAVIAVTGDNQQITNPDPNSGSKPGDKKDKKKGALDTCGYPNSSNPPRSLTIFNESECLSDFFPKQSFQLGMGQTLQLWYADEHALLLGIRGDVSAGGKTHDPKHLKDTTVVKSYPHTTAPSSPACMSNIAFGDPNATDPEGRPLYPALFITDVTATGSETAGDWQNGGHPIFPSTICGTWKYAVRVLGMTSKKDHDSTSIAVDADPAKNNWNLGSGSDTPPGGFGRTQGYGAEVIWNVDDLGLVPGHTYKLQFMVHDGDQNKSGGDVGEGCTTLTSMPGTLHVSISPESQTVCASTPATLCAIVDPTNPGVRPYQFTWSNGSHDSCITVNAPATGVTDSYNVTVTDHAGHTASATGTVTGGGTGTACIITGPNTICAGTPTEICGPLGATSYHWDNGETTRCISVTAQGVYTLTITGPCGTQTCSHPLTASSPPTCSITGPDEICAGQTAELCGPEAFQGTVYTYEWSTGATTRCITITGPGTYTLTVSTPTCGSSTCSKTVTAGALACTITGPANIDPDSTAELCGPKGTGFTYAWSTGDTSRCITINGPGTFTLTVTSPSCGTSTCSTTVLDRPTSSCRCSFFYPDSSNLPRSLVAYHESEIVAAVTPGRSGCPIGDNQLKLWYNDENALSMGIRRVVIYTSPTDSTIQDFPTTASPGAGCVTSPSYGTTAQSGNLRGNDTAPGGGRPLWPVLFLTDITFDKNDRTGDWEQGSTSGIPANRVCGAWVYGVRRVYAYLGDSATVQMDPSPAQNHWNLGGSADVPPGGFAGYPDQGYGAEVSWDLTSLGLQPGHRYRLETILHDGDQQAAQGGDAGHGCTRVVVTPTGAIAFDGGYDGIQKVDPSSARPAGVVVPQQFALSQNVPNPFRGGEPTVIRFAVPEKSTVQVNVFTVTGQRIATLASGSFEPGERSIVWRGTTDDGRSLPPGMYMAKMEAVSLSTGRFIQMRKMVMVK